MRGWLACSNPDISQKELSYTEENDSLRLHSQGVEEKEVAAPCYVS